jgi:predicted nucleic acid-binding protein
MVSRFVDASVFVRYLTGDDATKAARCFDLFQQVKVGAQQVTTSEAVVAEVVYVLSSPSLYNMPRGTIRAALLAILTLRGMRLPHVTTYILALDLFVAFRIDFEDALSIAHMEREGLPAIVSYDRDFDKVPGVRREEP